MQFECRVVGHELVIKKEERLVKVKLKNSFHDFKAELIVPEGDRVKYPFGSSAVVNFAVQQTIPLEK